MARLTMSNVQRATDANGAAENAAKRYIYDAGTTDIASAYSDAALTTAQSNPLTSDSSGIFAQSYVAAGSYKVVIKDAAGVTLYEEDNVTMGDEDSAGYAVGFGTVTQMLADTSMSYTAGTGKTVVAAGDFVTAGGFRYTVAASGATDHQLTTAGSMKLYVQPVLGKFYQVGAFADTAEGGDISSTLESALEFAFTQRNAHVVLPVGQYNLGSQVDATFPVSGSGYPVHHVTIDGSGCVLNVPTSNTTGGIKITTHNNFQIPIVVNLAIFSDHTYDGATTAGTLLHIECSVDQGESGWGSGGYPQLRLSNITLGTDRSAAEGRADKGLYVKNFWYPVCDHVNATTRYQYDLPDNGSFESGPGLEFHNCYSPELSFCRATGKWDIGIKIWGDDQPDFEFFALTECQSVNARIALLIDHTNAAAQSSALKEPGGNVVGGHYNGAQSGIEIRHHQSAVISKALLYLTNPDQGTALTTYSDAAFVRLVSCHEIDVKDCIINFGGHYTSDSDCSSGVRLEGTTEKCLVEGNRLYHDGIGVNNQATGSGNIMRRNVFDGRGAGTAGAPTKEFLDASDLMQKEDVDVPITPALEFGGGTTGITYSTQTGKYHRVGNHVQGYVDITLTSKGTDTGNALVDVPELPAPASGDKFGIVIPYSSGMNQGAEGGLLQANGKFVLRYKNASDNMNSVLDDTSFTGTDTLQFAFNYVVA